MKQMYFKAITHLKMHLFFILIYIKIPYTLK